ncbi:MAG: T9SS type B sorting domain-containing protein [Luteibaculum sp.]
MQGDKILYGIGFNVRNKQAALLRAFTISLAEVSFNEMHPDSLASANFQQVYYRQGYTEGNGVNVHEFDSPFCLEKDGNILVQVCVQNFADERSYNAGTQANFPDSVYNYSFHDWSNQSVNLCNSITTNAEVYLKRPITYFYLDSISKVDFKAISAKNPSGLEMINTVHQPEIFIQNFSCSNWNNYTINYQIDGSSVVTETPGITMQPGQKQNFVFNQPLTLDSAGFFEIKFWVDHPGDKFAANDTVRRLVWVRKDKFEGLDYTGTDFWVGFMHNFSNPATLVQEVFVTGLDTANVTVSMPALGWSSQVSLLPFEVKKVNIPVNYGGYTIATDKINLVQPTGIHVSSDAEISVYGLSQAPQSSDAYLAIPTQSLGREYYALAPKGTFFPTPVGELLVDELPAEILVVGTEANTNVQAILSGPANGKQKGDTLKFNLGPGETFLIKARVDRILGITSGTHDLTGTQITANNKVVVISGSQCATVPALGELGYCQYCDHIMEVQVPATAWGNRYYLTDFGYKPGQDIIRVVNGNYASTVVNMGGTIYTLSGRGDFIDHKFDGNIQIVASNPVQVVQMCTGGQCFPISSTDPFYVNAIPDVQWGSNYTFTTVVSGYFPFHYVNIIKRAKNGRVAIDGALINPNVFTQIAGTGYYAGKIAVSEGTHMITSDTTISVSVYGFGRDDGYGFPASGARLKPVNVPKPTLSGVSTPVSCFKFNDGTIEVSGADGTPPYTFIWDDGFLGASRDSLYSGWYTVTLIDDYGYSVRDSFHVMEADSFYVHSKIDSVSCPGGNDGSIEVEAFGGTYPFVSFAWADGSTNSRRENLGSAWYSFVLTDTNNCVVRDSLFVPQPDSLKFNAEIRNVLCFGDSSGFFKANPYGGTAPYSLEFRNIAGSIKNPDFLKIGNYRSEIEDYHGCKADTLITITQPSPLKFTMALTPSGCRNSPTGKVEIAPTGGTAPYQSAFGYGSYSDQMLYDGLQQGNYPIQVKDASGCTTKDTAKLGTVPVPSFSFETSEDDCQLRNGTALLTVSNGTPPFNSYWIQGFDTVYTGVYISDMSFGDYTVVATDKHCSETFDIRIDSTPRPHFTYQVTPASCGLDNGAVKFTMTSFDASYFIRMGGTRLTNDSLGGLAPGNYTFTVSDQACDVPVFVQIPEIPEIKLDSVRIVPQHCEESTGFIQVYISGGDGLISYSWEDYPGWNQNFITGLESDTFSLAVRDDYCTRNFKFFVPELSLPQVDFTTDPTHCESANGKIQANFSGGSQSYTFQWLDNGNSSSSTRTALDSGWFAIQLTDDYCSIVDSVFVDRVNDFDVEINSTPNYCELNNGSVAVTCNPSSNQKYVWQGFPQDSTPVLDSLDVGTYNVRVFDSLCSYQLKEDVWAAKEPEFRANVKPATCNEANGYIAFHPVTESGIFFLSDTLGNSLADSIAPLDSGWYAIRISDSFCTKDTLIRVNRPVLPSLAVTVKEESCALDNGEINGVPSGIPPFEILWSDNFSNSFTRSGLNSGLYHYQLKDAFCEVLDSVRVQHFPLPPSISQTEKLDATCGLNNGYIKAAVSGPEAPYTYSWNFPGMGDTLVQDNLAPGVYFLTVEGAVCKETVPFVIAAIPELKVQSQAIKNADCDTASGMALISAIDGQGQTSLEINGEFLQDFDTLSNLAAGWNVFTLRDDFCEVTDSVFIPQGLNLSYQLITQGEKCEQQDGRIEIVPQTWAGVYNVLWQDNSQLLVRNGLQGGTYQFTISDSLCERSETIVLPAHPAPFGSLEMVQTEACDQVDGILEFTQIQNVDSFIWNNGVKNQARLNGLSAGSYQLTAYNPHCSRTYTGNISATEGPIVNYQITPEYCDLQNAALNIQLQLDEGHSPFVVRDLSTGRKYQQLQFSQLNSGRIFYEIEDARGCTYLIQDEIEDEYTRISGGELSHSPAYVYEGEEVLLYQNLPANWSPLLWFSPNPENKLPGNLLSISNDTLRYGLFVEHVGGCIDTLFSTLFAKPNREVYIPNSFTPNKDGLNETFYPVFSFDVPWITRIFNRWGELIYEFTDQDPAWDGTYQGVEVRPGSYPVTVSYRIDGGEEKTLEALVTLVR